VTDVTAVPDVPTRRATLRILRQERARTQELLDGIPRSRLTTAGLGGGEWSPRDLVGHLASWEEYALDALDAWDRGVRPPVDALSWSIGTNAINRQNVERKAAWSVARVRRDSERTFAELLATIESLTDARWRGPASSRGRRPLGARLGSILGGPAGPFRHDTSHQPSLRSFVEDGGSSALSRGGRRRRSATSSR
jgi:hypothetical protein